jgi:hypothetical protein
MKKFLYLNRQIIKLTLGKIGRDKMNFNWGDSDTIIYKGYDNIIEFSIKDIDRRPVKIETNKFLEAKFFDLITGEFLFSKPLEVVDSSRGRYKLKIDPRDLFNINASTLKYAVTMIDDVTGEEIPLANDYSGISWGYLQINDNIDLKPINSIVIDELTPFTRMNSSHIPETWLTTGAIRGTIQRSASKNLTTVAIYFDNFSGIFKAESTLEVEVPSNMNVPSLWDELLISGTNTEKIYNSFTGIDAFNFYGNFNWFRLIFKPDVNNSGKIKKIIVV